jgi:hypothetical protein
LCFQANYFTKSLFYYYLELSEKLESLLIAMIFKSF